MNAEQLMFRAGTAADAAGLLVRDLWNESPDGTALPRLNPQKCKGLLEEARRLNCAATALDLLAQGVKPPRTGN